jgi:hypothetical protein
MSRFTIEAIRCDTREETGHNMKAHSNFFIGCWYWFVNGGVRFQL